MDILAKFFAGIASLAIAALLLVGCSSDGANADYNREIKMTPEQKAKMEEDMKNRPAPGTINPGEQAPGTPRAEPGTLKVPGKH